MLVVDGGGSLRCALLGDNIAEMAYKNGWSVSVPASVFYMLPAYCSSALSWLHAVPVKQTTWQLGTVYLPNSGHAGG